MVLFSGNFIVSIAVSSTILDLKKKIDEEEGFEPERQALYYMGYLIDDHTISVSDLTQLGGNTFSLVLPTAGSGQNIISDRQLFLITGSQHNFKTLLMPKNETKTYELSSKKFGIIYKKEGSLFHVEKFKVKGEGIIDIKTVDKDGTLTYKVTQKNEKNEDEELMGVIDTYDESKNRQEDGLSRAGQVAKILGALGAVGNFIVGVGKLVFEVN